MASLNFKTRDFVHLHLHSDYSLLQSTIQLKPLVKKLTEFEMKACAITDYGNMFGAVSFYSTVKSSGIRPIIGYEANLTFGDISDKNSTMRSNERPYYSLILLAKDLVGYHNLVHLSSKAFTEGFNHKPRIDLDLLESHSDGLVGLSSGMDGAIWESIRSGEIKQAQERAERFSELFGKDNFYLEVQKHGSEEERSIVKKLVELSRRSNIPLVATNDAHYLTADDARAHEVLKCIGEGRTLSGIGNSSSEYYVRSADEMWDIFGDELPEALDNTLKIAEICDLELTLGSDDLTLPEFPIPSESKAATADEYFRQVVFDGFELRKREVLQPLKEAGGLKYDFTEYEARLEVEIEIINRMGYAGYFLIVWEFIKYAVDKGIPVGPGRGSAAGSLVAYCLEITGIDPIQYDLLFERFLNPDRVSMPDIDIDFCIRGRADVINHVTEFYGRESVCQIVTFGTMASKAAIKDVGRALGVDLGKVERIAKLIPPPVLGRNIPITKALEQVSELRDHVKNDPQVKELIDLALRLEGCSRHTSVHAAGVVISPKPLHELVPVAMSSKNELTSQYTMNDLEKVGMLKMDFLGLTTLTIISDCLRSMKEKIGVEIDWNKIPLNDEKAMALFSEGRTDAIFQFESSGMQELCRRMKPSELEDLSALNALYRPGPLGGGMVDDYIARHRGEKKVEYLIPEMESVLNRTYGVLVYQEQIMQLAQKLGGYSLGEADLMRRAMGKKKREEMAVHERKFVDGAVAREINKKKAEEIFNLMAQFADYGFNRSHSIAYAYVAFQTAYLKAHYPAYFYASVLSHEADNSAKVYKYSSELRSLGLKLLPPDINESDDSFTPSDGAVRFGLSAIKGIGAGSTATLMEVRRNGKFTSLFDFASRFESGVFGKSGLERLIMAGAFDSLKPTDVPTSLWRAKLFAGIEPAISAGQRAASDRMRGQSGLFGEAGSATQIEDELPDVAPWTQSEISRHEKTATGLYLSVHPLDSFTETLADMRIEKIADHTDLKPGDRLQLAGIISASSVKYSKKGNRFCIFQLEDQSTGVKCLVWAEAYGKFGGLIKNDELIIAGGKVESVDGNEITFIVDDVQSLSEAMAKTATSVSITLPGRIVDASHFEEIFEVLSKNHGKCDVFLNFPIGDVEVELHSAPMRVKGSKDLEAQLRSRGCEVNWKI